MEEPTIAEKLRANLKWMRENGASQDEIRAEIATAQQAINGLNRADKNAADVEDATDAPSYGEQINRRLLALTDQVPGAHALIAAGRSVANGTSYANEANDIASSVSAYNADDTEKWRRRALKFAGMLPVGASAGRLAGSVAGQSALIGAAGNAGAANPEMTFGERGTATAAGYAAGGIFGKLGDVAGTTVQGLIATKPAQRILQMQAKRAISAKRLYSAAEAEGNNNLGPATKAIDAFVNEPDIAEIVADLQRTRQYRDLSPSHPKMLDGIIKELSDRGGMIAKGQMAPTPARPNVGRIRGQDVKDASEQGLEAISVNGGPMPTYAKAVKDFARRSQQIEAYRRGYQAVASEAVVGLPTLNNIERKSPEALALWISKSARGKQADALKQYASAGVTGATKEAMRRMSLIRPLWSLAAVESLADAPSVMRTAGIPRTAARSLFDLGTASVAGGGAGNLSDLFSR